MIDRLVSDVVSAQKPPRRSSNSHGGRSHNLARRCHEPGQWPGLFDILQIDIVQGRRFTAEDDRGAPVAIVSETMARVAWPGTSAIGKCFRIGWPPETAPCREIVGIARDWRRASSCGAGGRRPMHYYVPLSQSPSLPTELIVAAVATWLPARTASQAEPCELLRRD